MLNGAFGYQTLLQEWRGSGVSKQRFGTTQNVKKEITNLKWVLLLHCEILEKEATKDFVTFWLRQYLSVHYKRFKLVQCFHTLNVE